MVQLSLLAEMLTLETKLADSKIRWANQPPLFIIFFPHGVTECRSGAVTWVSPFSTAYIDASFSFVFL